MDESINWGRALHGELLERWPKTEGGEPEKPELLCCCKNIDLSDELLTNMLEAFGIPCLRVYPGDGVFGRLILGVSGQGVEVYVPQSMLEDARELCKAQPDQSESGQT